MSIATSLRRARRHSGESLRSVASRAGVGAGNLSAIENGRRDPTTSTVDRIAFAVGIEFIPVATQGRTPAARAADQIAEAEERGEFPLAYRRFIQLADDLAAVDPVTRVLLAAEAPAESSSRWLDAVAALVELRLREVSAPVPSWVVDRAGDSGAVWEPQRGARPLPVSAQLDDVPPEFLRRGVAIERGELASV